MSLCMAEKRGGILARIRPRRKRGRGPPRRFEREQVAVGGRDAAAQERAGVAGGAAGDARPQVRAGPPFGRAVRRDAFRFDLPVLFGSTALSWLLVRDGGVSRANAWILLAVFAAWLAGSVLLAMRGGVRAESAASASAPGAGLSGRMAAFWTVAGLVLLVASSRALVWGAVELAQALGVSDLVIGLTVVAIGTSLPELASSVAAARKGADDLAVGNIIGSNLFNTLAVVGLAGAIRAMPDADPDIAARDIPTAFALTAALILFGLPIWRRGSRDGRLPRAAGWLFLAAYAAYTTWLVLAETGRL